MLVPPFPPFSIRTNPLELTPPTLIPEPFILLIIVFPAEFNVLDIFNKPLPPCTIIVSPFVVKAPVILISLPFTSLYIVVFPPVKLFLILILSVPLFTTSVSPAELTVPSKFIPPFPDLFISSEPAEIVDLAPTLIPTLLVSFIVVLPLLFVFAPLASVIPFCPLLSTVK